MMLKSNRNISLILSAILFLSSCGSLGMKELVKAEKGYQAGNHSDLDIILKIAYTSQDNALRKEAVRVLGRLQGDGIAANLVKLSVDPVVGDGSLIQLGKRQDKNVSATLIELHKNKVKPLFLETLGYLADLTAIEFLAKYLRDDQLWKFALSAIEKIGQAPAQALYRKIVLDSADTMELRLAALALMQLGPYPENIQTFAVLLASADLRLDFLRQIKEVCKKEPRSELLASVKGLYARKKNQADFKKEILELYAILKNISPEEARIFLEPTRPAQKVQKWQPEFHMSLSGKNEQQSQREFSKALDSTANLMGTPWSKKKSQDLYTRVDRSFKNMTSGNQSRFQGLFRILKQKYPDKSFTEIEKMVTGGMKNGMALDLLIRDTLKKFPSRPYQVAYLAKYLSISNMEAQLLLNSYAR